MKMKERDYIMAYYNHVEMMKDFIKERLSRGVNTFTHKDILNVTNTNCPYSVLRSLKKYYEIDYMTKTKDTLKKDMKGNEVIIPIKFREYIVIKEKDNNAKDSNIWGKSKIGNIPSLFMGVATN